MQCKGFAAAFRAALAAAALAGGPVAAAELTLTQDATDTPVVRVTGALVPGDDLAFISMVKPLTAATVVLSGPAEGPDAVLTGLNLGSVIAAQGYATRLEAGRDCAAGCMLAWLGGAERTLRPGARLAFVSGLDTGTETGAATRRLVEAFLGRVALPAGVTAADFADGEAAGADWRGARALAADGWGRLSPAAAAITDEGGAPPAASATEPDAAPAGDAVTGAPAADAAMAAADGVTDGATDMADTAATGTSDAIVAETPDATAAGTPDAAAAGTPDTAATGTSDTAAADTPDATEADTADATGADTPDTVVADADPAAPGETAAAGADANGAAPANPGATQTGDAADPPPTQAAAAAEGADAPATAADADPGDRPAAPQEAAATARADGAAPGSAAGSATAGAAPDAPPRQTADAAATPQDAGASISAGSVAMQEPDTDPEPVPLSLPDGQFWIVLESSRAVGALDPGAYAIAPRRFGLTTVRTRNGYFANVIGPFPEAEAVATRARLQAQGAIPRDAYLSQGLGFVERVKPAPPPPRSSG